MSKRMKIPVFEFYLLAAASFTLSSLWVATGVLSFLGILLGWNGFDFIISISTELTISLFIWIFSGLFLKYMIDKNRNRKRKILCLKHSVL